MHGNRREKIISWAFGIASVAVVWQLQLPSLLDDWARKLGAVQGSWLYRIIVDGGVPVALVIIAGVAVYIYERVIWPYWPGSHCMAGWWVYALVAQTKGLNIDVVGYFHLAHNIDEIKVPEGHAFYVENTAISYRGDWHADIAWTDGNELRLLFSMRAVNPSQKALPSHYDGYFEVHNTLSKPVIGSTAWIGYFQDLGDRRDVVGPIYAERLIRFPRRNSEEIRALLVDRSYEMLTYVHTRSLDRGV